jgi:hypothetical protein
MRRRTPQLEKVRNSCHSCHLLEKRLMMVGHLATPLSRGRFLQRLLVDTVLTAHLIPPKR